MNEKTLRYIGLGFGIVLTLIILYFGAYVEIGGYSDFNIRNTVIYDIFRNFVFSRNLSYVLWYLVLFVGLWLSWKYRLKLAKIIKKLTTIIHKKV